MSLRNRRSRKKNLLVISDLHLGEGLRGSLEAPTPEGDERLRSLERELSSFLIHYTAERIKGRPWRLVVNGDMVDFMSILLFPRESAERPDPAQVVSSLRSGGHVLGEAQVFGLGFGAEESRLKMERVLDHHAAVFRLLAKFLAAGNDLVIVLGNHDMEFSHEEVQRAFIERLCALGEDRRLAARIQFCPWFYYEPDVIYIEHGHQYDEYCSFDYQLCPASSSGLALSFAHAGMRFFGNLVPSYDQRTAEHWGALDYLRWGYSLGLKTLLYLTYMYGLLAWKTAEIGSLLARPSEEKGRRARHRMRFRALAETFGLQREKLVQLDALRVPPVVRRVGKILTALFMDRLLLGLLSAFALTVAIVLCPGLWKVGACGAILGAAWAGNAQLRRFRGVTSPHALRRVTRAIHKIVRAPLIVFGHSHEAERVALDDGAVYYNTGTWMDGGGAHVGTHLVVLSEEAPYAELRRWQNNAAVKLEL